MATGLYVPIRGDYSEFQKDIKRLQGIARQSAEELSNIFGNAFSKGDASRGLSQIAMALKKLGTAASTVGAQFKPAIAEINEFAHKCGVSANQVERLVTQMGYAARERQMLSSLRTLQRQAGLTDSALAQLARHRNLFAESGSIASEGLGVRTAAKIKADIREAEAAFKQFQMTANLTGESTQRQFEAMTAKVRQFSMELMTASQKEAFLRRERYDSLVAQAGQGRTSYAQFEAREKARNAVSAFQEMNGRLPRPKEIREIAAATGIAANQIRRMRDELDHSSNAFKALIGYAQVWLTFGFAHTAIDFVKTAMALENVKVAFQAIYGTADMAQAKLDYVRQVSEQLGLSFLDTAEGAKKLFAAAAGTPVEKEANMVFKAFSDMSAAMKLSGDETKGVFLALSQMISKGKVSAEELRQQLAERMPGAVNLFARSIGKTTQELDKMLQKGEVTLEHFLMFSREVQNTYGAGAIAAGGSLQAELNRLKNTWVDFKTSMTDTDTLASGVRSLTAMFKTLSPAVEFVSKHVHTLAAVTLAGWIGSSLAPGGKLNGVLTAIGNSASKARERVEAFNKGQQAMVINATGATAAVGKLRAGLGALGSGLIYGGLFAIAGILLDIAYNAAQAARGFQNARKNMSEYVADAAKLKDSSEASSFTPELIRKSLNEDNKKHYSEWDNEYKKLGEQVQSTYTTSHLATDRMFGQDDVGKSAAEHAYKVLGEYQNAFRKAIESGNVNLAAEIKAKMTDAWINGLGDSIGKIGGVLGVDFNKAFGSTMEEMSQVLSNTSKKMQTFSSESADASKRLGLNAAQMAEDFKKMQQAAEKTDLGKTFISLQKIDDLKKTLNDTSIEFSKEAAASADYAAKVKSLGDSIGDASIKFNEHKSYLESYGEAYRHGAITLDEFQAKQKEVAGEGDELKRRQDELANSITTMAMAAGGTDASFNIMIAAFQQSKLAGEMTEEAIQAVINKVRELQGEAQNAMIQAQSAMNVMKINRQTTLNNLNTKARIARKKGNVNELTDAYAGSERTRLDRDLTSEEMAALRRRAESDINNDKLWDSFSKSGKGGGGKKGGRVDNTAEKYDSAFEGFRKEIAKLQGEVDKVTLDKKFADMDKALKGSTADIKALKKEYFEAFNANKVHELRKEIMQLTGDERGLAELEIADKMQAFHAEVDGVREAAKQLGVEAPEDLAKLGEAYEKALRANEQEQYLQKLIPIQKDIAYNDKDRAKLLALQNQLIDIQAEKMATTLPQDVVDRWKELQRLQVATDSLSGLKRGFIRLAQDAKSAADIMEETVVSTADMMGDALGDFFMKGKFGMQDFLNSWISMISQMIMKAATSQIFSMIGGLFNFGSGIAGAASAASSAASAVSQTSSIASTIAATALAHGGVLTGLHGYANQIVSRPTLFSYGSQLTKFAKGGIMGEAGPEAIMPLTRTASGHLGVRTDGGSGASSMQITLVVNDRTEGGINASVQNGELDGRQIAIIVKQVENAMVARSLNGKSMYTKYLDKTRGLSNAKQLY